MPELEPIKCRAAVMYEEGEPLIIEDVLVGVPTDNQVRIRIVSAGICASDAHFVWGEQKTGNKPVVLGHEGAGVVESVGQSVHGLEPGDHVLTNIMAQCGHCESCCNPLVNLCPKQGILALGRFPNKKFASNGNDLYGFCGLGVFSEYVLLGAHQVVKIDKQINLEASCVISCAVATGFYAATNQAKVTFGSTAAVWGLGAIGLNAVYGCKFNGAKNIIGIDINNDKKEIAHQYGCTEFINPNELDCPVEEYLQKKFDGVDYAIECIGIQPTIDAALNALSHSGTLALVGVSQVARVNVPLIHLSVGRKIIGGFLGNKPMKDGFREIVELCLSGKYDLDPLITHRFSLEAINEAFQTLKEGKCIRSLIVFDSQDVNNNNKQ